MIVQGQLQELTVSGQDLCNAHEYVFYKVQLVHKGVMDAHAIKLNVSDQIECQGSAHNLGSRPNRQDVDYGVHEYVEKPGK